MRIQFCIFSFLLSFSTTLFASFDPSDEFFKTEIQAHFQNENCQNPILDVQNMLLVIDMQHRFPASRSESVQKNILSAIQKAMEEKKLILFIEYASMGPTIPSLLSAVDSYSLSVRMIKQFDSAYEPLKSLLDVMEISNLCEIQICGVNTDLCVLNTVRDLCERPFAGKITVLQSACNADAAELHYHALEDMEILSRSSPILSLFQ